MSLIDNFILFWQRW